MRILLFITFVLQLGFNLSAQDQDMSYLFKDRAMLSVTQSELAAAVTLMDIHSRYPGDWVATYFSTEIRVTENGKTVSAMGANETLNSEQKRLLRTANPGSEVTVWVKYMPDNTLRNNTAKEMDFTFEILPAVLATFTDGEESLNSYIDNNIIAKLTAEQQANLKISKIDFSISPDGSITDVKMMESSGNDAIDAILIHGICGMPKWSPATTTDGTNTKHLIKFFISNRNGGCLMY